jgi:uncharacterized protein (TIGR00255 family)
MTGYGRAKLSDDNYEVSVEIRSVNHRYFEYSSRLSRSLQFLDDKVKELVKSRIIRGKIEVGISFTDNSENSITLQLNEQYADAYISAMRALGKKYKIKDDLKLSALTGNNDLFTVKKTDLNEEQITELIINCASAALDSFVLMRAAEGEKLVMDIKSRADYILGKVAIIENRSPETVKEYRQRLESKIRELIADTTVDEQRLLTETAIFADKVAVAEETVRLRSHISALTTLLETGGDIGKKLDFIVQEMNRETNTIGSKAQDIEIGKIVVDIKSEIEKIREQIQNIE